MRTDYCILREIIYPYLELAMLYLYWQVKGEEVIESLLRQRSCSRVQTFQMIHFHFGPEGNF